MKNAKAPEGKHSHIHIRVQLGNGTSKEYTWVSSLALASAVNKAIGWAKLNMSREKVKGRSHVEDITIYAEYRKGLL